MKMKLGTLVAAVCGTMLIASCGKDVQHADLERALDITAQTLDSNSSAQVNEQNTDSQLQKFADELAENMNNANPKVHPDPLGMEAKSDGSFVAYHDSNSSAQRDSGEKDLFKIEIDAEGQRLIATDTNGYARDHSFSGTSLLAGALIGSLLARQRGAGIGKGSFRNRNIAPKGSSPSARGRSGSGSHSSGK